ncbi:CBM35 domain-containing protein [Actinoplanes italicus]|uniref:CBM35 domain-containing protein n=1 Tax=Actinoplanes italicus TaxID=113567 RepID=UPI0011B23423|nr:CBM35 domain-containing protein [Actinoplanes italicus]
MAQYHSPSATRVQAGPSKMEAENGTLTGGAVKATGHTGTGFVGGSTRGNRGAARTSVAVTVTAAGQHNLTLCHANGARSIKILSLYVNGALVERLSLGATANWGIRFTQTISAALNAGPNTDAIRFGSADSAIAGHHSGCLTLGPVCPAQEVMRNAAHVSVEVSLIGRQGYAEGRQRRTTALRAWRGHRAEAPWGV